MVGLREPYEVLGSFLHQPPMRFYPLYYVACPSHLLFFFFALMFAFFSCATSSGSQKSFLDQHSGITPGRLRKVRKAYRMPEIEPWSTVCKANFLSVALSLQSQPYHPFLKIISNSCDQRVIHVKIWNVTARKVSECGQHSEMLHIIQKLAPHKH